MLHHHMDVTQQSLFTMIWYCVKPYTSKLLSYDIVSLIHYYIRSFLSIAFVPWFTTHAATRELVAQVTKVI